MTTHWGPIVYVSQDEMQMYVPGLKYWNKGHVNEFGEPVSSSSHIREYPYVWFPDMAAEELLKYEHCDTHTCLALDQN